MSASSVIVAGSFPRVRSTLVAPMVPLPARRMSTPPKARATRNPTGTAPIRYARARPSSTPGSNSRVIVAHADHRVRTSSRRPSRPALPILHESLRPRAHEETIEVVGAGHDRQRERDPQHGHGKEMEACELVGHALFQDENGDRD